MNTNAQIPFSTFEHFAFLYKEAGRETNGPVVLMTGHEGLITPMLFGTRALALDYKRDIISQALRYEDWSIRMGDANDLPFLAGLSNDGDSLIFYVSDERFYVISASKAFAIANLPKTTNIPPGQHKGSSRF